MSLTTQYLFQVDVLIDDSLVPLRVDSLACVFGLPLVFGTGGEHITATHTWSTTCMQITCVSVNLRIAGSRRYWSRAQCHSRGKRMNVMHIVWMVTMYGPMCMDSRV